MKKVLLLFDIDGTLTVSRKIIGDNMKHKLREISSGSYDDAIIHIGVVGGSDLSKQREQLDDCWNLFMYQFAENGLVFYKNCQYVDSTSFVDHLGQDKMNELIDICLEIFSKIKCPEKTGTFIEHRIGMLNISPVGRNCTQDQRDRFYEYDKIHNIRENIKRTLEERFANRNNIKISIGGQISLDVFPHGWDKTYCLKYVESQYDEIHFFGDRTMVGGNDYEIYNDHRVIGHKVTNPDDTIRQIRKVIDLHSV